jgi:3-phenylpropionate/cinnamic acid dioxygenase small subunit
MNNIWELIQMAKRIKEMHLIKERDLKENFLVDQVFKESSIDESNYTIKNVCLFGRRESANGRTYQDKAIDSISNLSNGCKVFLNHISKSEMNDRSGVRNVLDWAGVLENSGRRGEAVFANLKVRKQYWELFKDIAIMKPVGIGHSIDARVKVYQDNDGKENVADVESLRSVDLVSSAATTNNLFEASIKDNKVSDPIFELFTEGYTKYRVEEKFNAASEGMIQDKIDNDKIKWEIQDLSCTCNELVRNVLYNEEMSIEDKKSKIMAIFDDLDVEIKKRMTKIKESMEGEKLMELKLSDVLGNKEIMEGLADHFSKQEKYKTLEADLETSKTLIDTLTKESAEKDKVIDDNKKAIVALESKNQELAKDLDAVKAAEAIAVKKQMITDMIAESKLPKEVVTDIFFEDLMTLSDKEQIAKRLEDRKSLVSTKLVINNGEPRTESNKLQPTTDKTVLTKEERESKIANLAKALKR